MLRESHNPHPAPARGYRGRRPQAHAPPRSGAGHAHNALRKSRWLQRTRAPCGSATRRRSRKSRRASASRRDGFRYTRAPSEPDSWTIAFMRSTPILHAARSLRLIVLALAAPERRPPALLLSAFLRRRRGAVFCLCRRRIGFLLQVLGNFALPRLEIVDGLLQRNGGSLQRLDLAVRGIQFLLIVGSQFSDLLLQEIDVALQTTGPPLHGLLDRADLDARHVLRKKFRRHRRPDHRGRGRNNNHSSDHQNLVHHANLLGGKTMRQRYHTDTSFPR